MDALMHLLNIANTDSGILPTDSYVMFWSFELDKL